MEGQEEGTSSTAIPNKGETTPLPAHVSIHVHGVPDFHCLTVERLCDSVTGN